MKKIIIYIFFIFFLIVFYFTNFTIKNDNLYIFEKNKKKNIIPYKIKYFGDSISSGLYSYLGSDILKKAEIKKYTTTFLIT